MFEFDRYKGGTRGSLAGTNLNFLSAGTLEVFTADGCNTVDGVVGTCVGRDVSDLLGPSTAVRPVGLVLEILNSQNEVSPQRCHGGCRIIHNRQFGGTRSAGIMAKTSAISDRSQ